MSATKQFLSDSNTVILQSTKEPPHSEYTGVRNRPTSPIRSGLSRRCITRHKYHI